MPKATEEWRVNEPAETVWAQLSEFENLAKLIPNIQKVETHNSGRVRLITVGAGKGYRERLLDIDEKRRKLTYEFAGSEGIQLPYGSYLSTLQVQIEVPGKSCAVFVTRRYSATEMSETSVRKEIRAFYGAIFTNL